MSPRRSDVVRFYFANRWPLAPFLVVRDECVLSLDASSFSHKSAADRVVTATPISTRGPRTLDSILTRKGRGPRGKKGRWRKGSRYRRVLGEATTSLRKELFEIESYTVVTHPFAPFSANLEISFALFFFSSSLSLFLPSPPASLGSAPGSASYVQRRNFR